MHRTGQVTEETGLQRVADRWDAADGILWYHPGASRWNL